MLFDDADKINVVFYHGVLNMIGAGMYLVFEDSILEDAACKQNDFEIGCLFVGDTNTKEKYLIIILCI